MQHDAKSLFSTSTVLTADSIESHPRLPFVFAESTYQVDKADDGTPSPEYTRRGRCAIRMAEPKYESSAINLCVSTNSSTLCQYDTTAILDTKWCAKANQDSSRLFGR